MHPCPDIPAVTANIFRGEPAGGALNLYSVDVAAYFRAWTLQTVFLLLIGLRRVLGAYSGATAGI